MSKLRGKTHIRLPSHTGDVGDEKGSKSFATVLRVKAANWHSPGSSSRKIIIYRTVVLFICACAFYLYGPWGWLTTRPSTGTPPKNALNGSSRQDRTHERRPKVPKGMDPDFRPAPHTYRPDGLLDVHPNGTHPVFDLIKKAEAAWASKIRRASATLQDAIDEYIKRYGRAPPIGFDKWWEYVQENNVQLPDEYDSINERLEPFWGIAPLDLRRILADWEDNSDVPVIVFGKSDKKPIRILKNGMPEGDQDMFAQMLRERIDLLVDVEDDIPDFRAVISPADTPNLLTDWELREEALKAVRKKRYIDVEGPPPAKHGWLSACPPSAPVHKKKLDFYAPINPSLLEKKKKSFIFDHRAAMDPCQHPSHLFLSGQFLSHYEGPSPHRVIVPQFSSSATTLHYDILPIPPRGWGEERRDIPWEEKYDERLLWRGTNTGMLFHVGNHWQQSQRVRLVEWANDVRGSVRVLAPPRAGEEMRPAGEGESWPKVRVFPAMLDISFAGGPVQCDEISCEELRRDYDWRRHMPIEESSRYKYVIDVDGNGWSSRFKRLMNSNALVFKSTVYPEWFSDRIQPWVHYVPISLDYSELFDTFVFFRGDINGEGNHDALGRKIAYAGAKWADSFWREEDATAYMFRLFLEYARLMSLDRDAMTMKVSSSHH